MKVTRTSKTRKVFNATRRQLQRAVKAGAKAAVETMKRNVPVDEGDLESTVKMIVQADGSVLVSAGGESEISDKIVDYAADVEYGTTHNTANGSYTIAAQPFFRLGLEDGAEKMREEVKIVDK